MNEVDKAFLIACVIGDGSIKKVSTMYGTFNYYLEITHSIKQSEYLRYKVSRLNTILKRGSSVVLFENNSYPGIRYSAGNSEVLKPLHDLLYPNGVKKIACKEVLESLTPEALAIWWMDDGSCSKKYNSRDVGGRIKAYIGYLHTYETEEDNLLIVNTLNAKFGLNLKSVPDKGWWRILLNTTDLRQLRRIIEPYIQIENMKYKIDIPYKRCKVSSPNAIDISNGL